MNKQKLLLCGLCILLIFLVGCDTDPKTKKLMTQAKSLFGEMPDAMPGSQKDTAELINLGEKLYHDVRLSVNDTQSCNSCHNVKSGGFGVDNQKFSPGALPGTRGDRNSPTVLNAGFHLAQFWDGRAKTLADQAKGPILNPVEMGMPNEKAVIKKISAIQEYQDSFGKAFPNQNNPINYDNLGEAIAAFERTLITHDKLDQFIAGDSSALDSNQLEGLEIFIETGCASCHNGPILGGNSYRKIGEIRPYQNKTDKGRFDVTKQPHDMYLFKVPSLKNIAKTSPYFHDGSVDSLQNAIKQMAWLQLGKKISDSDAVKIENFLNSLTGSIPK